MMIRIGDLFPPQFRKDFCKNHLIKGAALRAPTEITTPPKIKLFVVWQLEESINRIGISFINSEITSIKSTWLQALQCPLSQKNNPFLTHDSFLDCSRIHEKDLNKVRDSLVMDTEIFRGNIFLDDLLKAEEIIRDAITIERKLKKRYGFI